ncbi:class II aldolase/adducin family protein [Halegenticoccus tardaugens]|uniref:class II aldolase/adducin family protein n=1 Tax=Halegenticoccus tardaugens TaxID=2071624 RepID=UPI00100A93C1|nr:class II aldolase/adducin family protein [Halegenticoccus tardaugens]
MTEPATLRAERERVGQLGREMLAQGLTRGTGGNVSVRSGDGVAISPSGVPYEDVTPETVPVVDLDGNRLRGDLKPSSETPMHAILYRSRDDVGGIVHTHSPYASTFASLNEPIPASHYLIAYVGTEIPVAGYEPPGTEALGGLAAEAMGEDCDAVLLKNHGVVAVGSTGADALEVAQMVEYCARIHYQAISVGEPEILPDDSVRDLRKMFTESYGQR